jgi:diguanylate cyclase (GGDEF)-like protein
MRDFAHQPDPRILSSLERFERWALLVVSLLAAAILALWWLPRVASLAPAGWEQMKATTAVGMLVATASLACSAPRCPRAALRIGPMAALALAALGLAVLLSYALDLQLAGDALPARPSPQTAIGFILAGLSLAVIRRSGGAASLFADIGAVALCAFVLFLLGGYLFGVTEFVGIDAINRTSPQTLFCFLVLAFLIAARRAADGMLLGLLVNIGIGSHIARLVLPGIVAMPFVVFASIHYVDGSHLIGAVYARAVATPLLVMLSLGVVVWMGQRTNELEQQLRLQSLTDHMTNILNSRGFAVASEYAIHMAERTGTPLTVFYFDLDGLKQANDTLGHDVGSWMIKQFAEVLVATFRKSDVVARMGGDEFVALAAAAPESVGDILERLQRGVAACNASSNTLCRIAYSVGYAQWQSGVDTGIDRLVASADAKMYEQKLRRKAA